MAQLTTLYKKLLIEIISQLVAIANEKYISWVGGRGGPETTKKSNAYKAPTCLYSIQKTYCTDLLDKQ